MATKKTTKKKTAKKTAKKTTKKAVKKTAKVSKKSVSQKKTKKAVKKNSGSKKKIVQKKDNLVHAPYEHVFWVCDGMVLKNLRDLANALEHMSEESYRHHANSKRNDFSAWVRDILQEPRLALALDRAKTRKEALKKVKTKIKRLE